MSRFARVSFVFTMGWLAAACGGSTKNSGSDGGASTDMAMTGGEKDMAVSGSTDMAITVGSTDMAGGSTDMAIVSGLPSATAKKVVTGNQHTCALTTGGAVRCWGATDHGQLGNGTLSPDAVFNTPVQVTGLTSGALDIAAAGDTTCAVTSAGGVQCWGANDQGQIGNGTMSDSATPVNVTGLSSGVTSVSVGATTSCALAAGVVKCWGANDDYQLAIADDGLTASPAPVAISGLGAGVKSIAAGAQFNCAVTSANGLKCWGINASGELGQNDNMPAKIAAPADVMSMTSGVAAVSAGASETCAFASTGGAVSCWGRDDEGELGDGHDGVSVEQHAPVAVSGPLTGATSISVGFYFACAVSSGAAKCWGDGSDGELGNNDEAMQDTPVQVMGLSSGVAQISAGTHHGCAVLSTGAVKCWGLNGAGQLGDGKDGTGTGVTENNSDVPVAVLSLP